MVTRGSHPSAADPASAAREWTQQTESGIAMGGKGIVDFASREEDATAQKPYRWTAISARFLIFISAPTA